jgi:HEAT repeat protein/lysophospholipase L1-like esterase
MLGDSVTVGDFIEPHEAYPQVLEARLRAQGRRIDVMNAGLWGWSTRQERIAYDRLLRKYRLDHVVLAVCLNDIPELQNNLSRPSPLLAALHRRSALVRGIVNAPAREIQSVEKLFEQPDAESVRQGTARFFDEVRAVRREVEGDGARFGLLVFPFRFQVEPGAPAPRVQADIDAFCAAEGIRCLDLLPALVTMGPRAFVDYDHLSPAGAALVAETILRSDLLPGGFSDPDTLRERFPRGPVASWLQARRPPVGEGTLLALGQALKEREPKVRAAAAWALETIGAAAAGTVPALVDSLDDPSEVVRAAAARALGSIGAEARAAAPALFEALADPRQQVRWAAARALSRMELGAPDAVAPLAAALRSEDSYVRGFAAWSLGNIGPAAAAAVPALIEALDRREGYGPGGASAALAKMGPAASAAVPALERGLSDPDGERRWKAARTLGRIGPAARAAVPALVKALGDPHDFVRAHSARALGRIAPAEAADALRASARDREEIVRNEARDALARVP